VESPCLIVRIIHIVPYEIVTDVRLSRDARTIVPFDPDRISKGVCSRRHRPITCHAKGAERIGSGVSGGKNLLRRVVAIPIPPLLHPVRPRSGGGRLIASVMINSCLDIGLPIPEDGGSG